MKKFVVLLLVITLLFISGCSGKEATNSTSEDLPEEYSEELLACKICNNAIEDKKNIQTEEGFLCVSCAFDNNYIMCRGCNLYFQSDIALDATAYYCSSCACDDKNAYGCCFCWSGPLDYDKLVEFTVDGEPCYMCVDCCADYFVNVEPMKPCFYCIECGKIFSGKFYPHYIYADTVICEDCINEKGFKQCSLCKKYYDDGENNICAFCLEQ